MSFLLDGVSRKPPTFQNWGPWMLDSPCGLESRCLFPRVDFAKLLRRSLRDVEQNGAALKLGGGVPQSVKSLLCEREGLSSGSSTHIKTGHRSVLL